ncbi:MAG TPA: type II secretion system major pseudopilin GspG [Casimicrobiaceae bacterium]
MHSPVLRARGRGPSTSLRTGPSTSLRTGLSTSLRTGFTLVEIMVVIVILGILAALVVPRIIERPDEARVVAAKNDLATILQALKLYRLDNQRYPTTEQGLAALVVRPTAPPAPPNWKPNGYLERLPKDPWGNPYQYLNPGLHGEVDVFSFGADGQPGGTGYDADIGSWDL